MKYFKEFIFENLPGTEKTPETVLEHEDFGPYRNIDWINDNDYHEPIRFEVLAMAKNFAIFHDKIKGDFYVADFENEDLDDYILRYNDSNTESIDFDALVMWATDTYDKIQKDGNVGVGIDAWENGDSIVKLDSNLLQYLIGTINPKVDKVLKGLGFLLENVSWTSGGVILIYGAWVNDKRNLYAAYVKNVRMLGKKDGSLEGKIATIHSDIYRISNSEKGLEAKKIQYDHSTLKKFIGLNELKVPINGNTKTPFWWETINEMNIGTILRKYEEKIKKLDVNL